MGCIIAKQLAELGAHVITVSPDVAARSEAADGQAIAVRGSLASSEDVERLFRAIEERFESLDYYVHNAADEVITSLDKATENDWEKVFRTDIVGYHLAALRAAKLMKKRGGGRIVALSSPAAHRYIEHYGVMGPVKAALESLTMYLAQELAAYNIQVNSVSAALPHGEQQPASLEEAADAAIFLLTDAARKVNGSAMVVDGGWSQRI
jgi:NAD(P)-dependent dehydrogenase (short-subunit alcohol dehydrogenase family)